MVRFSTSFALLTLASTNFAFASPKKYDLAAQEEQNRNADCDNGCFFTEFKNGVCSDDPACECNQKEYRENYFCCLGKCADSVLPDSITRLGLACEAWNIPFTFDPEAVCGITVTTSRYSAPFSVHGTTISTANSETKTSVASDSATLTSSANEGEATSTGTKEDSTDKDSSTASETAQSASSIASETAESTPSPTNGALSVKGNVLNGPMVLAAISGLLLLQ